MRLRKRQTDRDEDTETDRQNWAVPPCKEEDKIPSNWQGYPGRGDYILTLNIFFSDQEMKY